MKKCNLSCMMDSWTNTGANSFNLDTQSLVLGISSICRWIKSNQCSSADHPALPQRGLVRLCSVSCSSSGSSFKVFYRGPAQYPASGFPRPILLARSLPSLAFLGAPTTASPLSYSAPGQRAWPTHILSSSGVH